MEHTETIRNNVLRNGYAFIRALHVEHEVQDAFERIGKIDILEGFSSIQTLTPKKKSYATPNTYSGNYGLGEFPFHTDLAHWAIPPRYIALRCEVGSSRVATRIIDGAEVINSLGRDFLYQSLVTPRRPTQYGFQLLRLVEEPNGKEASLFRWDSMYLRAANKAAVESLEKIIQILERVNPLEVFLENRGDTLVIDNWRMLHARSSVGIDALLRDVKRAYMSELL